MDKKGQQVLAYGLIGFGVLMFVANFLNIDFGNIFWPLLLVIVGAALVFRPQTLRSTEEVKYFAAGDLVLDEEWEVRSREFRMFAGNIDLDLFNAEIPPGETLLRVLAFAVELDINLPEGVGIAINTNAIMTETKIMGEKNEYIFSGLNYKSEGYDEAERKIRIETTTFVTELELEY